MVHSKVLIGVDRVNNVLTETAVIPFALKLQQQCSLCGWAPTPVFLGK